MQKMTKTWDYLIVTAANEQQARAYDFQIRRRKEAGEIPQVRNCLVIADIEGKRIGSGGSTLHCLDSVLRRQRLTPRPGSFEDAEALLSGLRILIVHAGGDSRRLPAYSHCGKMFVPVPAPFDSSLASTLFDRLLPSFLNLPESHPGQIVVASGDALILFDPSSVKLDSPGITALGCLAPAEEAAHHGVFCSHENGSVRRFLQKPSPQSQIAAGAMNQNGMTALDIGVMNCDAAAAVGLMRTFFEQRPGPDGESELLWKAPARDALFSHGIDLYREVCCALGTETTLNDYLDAVRSAGSTLDRTLLTEWFDHLRQIPFRVEVLPGCKFLHFGTTRQLITSGMALLEADAVSPMPPALILNSDIQSEVVGEQAWVEGCVLRNGLTLDGDNALVGVDVVDPLALPKGACMDISSGAGRNGRKVWFLRYYGIDDTFKHSAQSGGTFCGLPLRGWLNASGAADSDIWPPEVPENERTLWNARMFPALTQHQDFREWLWLLGIESATDEQKKRFLAAERYSSSEIALRVDPSEFHDRRSKVGAVALPLQRGHNRASDIYAEGWTVDA